MPYQEIQLSREAGTVIITLNRPEKLNAYTPDMGEELVHALREAAADDQTCAAVITGAGNAFCAGADLEYLKGKTSRSGKRIGEEEFIAGFTEEFAALPILTVAAINGAAAGIGITGMLAADIRVVAADAKLVLNFAELGIMPGMGSTYFLPRLVGEARARELLLSRRRLDGTSAAQYGLANAAVPKGQVLSHALEIAEGAAGCKAGTIDAIKRGLAAGAESSLAQALVFEKQLAKEVRR
ncbi:MAG: enoyl-CoA hydratase/isomerase family protein [Halioglobus sp.]